MLDVFGNYLRKGQRNGMRDTPKKSERQTEMKRFQGENDERYLFEKYLSFCNILIICRLHKKSETVRLKYFFLCKGQLKEGTLLSLSNAKTYNYLCM